MGAIYRKELRSYFYSPIGYMFIAVFMCLAPMFFIQGSLAYQIADISSLFGNINIVYIFLTAILTMGLIAEEKSKKTDHLLLSSPISVAEIVVGKYLAAVSVLGITLVLSLIFPLILRIYGDLPLGQAFASYVGFGLLWALFISIGLFISSMTESQILAAIFTFGVLFVLYMLDSVIVNISNPILRGVLILCSPVNRYNDFQIGIIDIAHIVYYFSLIGLFVFLTIRNIDRKRYL